MMVRMRVECVLTQLQKLISSVTEKSMPSDEYRCKEHALYGKTLPLWHA